MDEIKQIELMKQSNPKLAETLKLICDVLKKYQKENVAFSFNGGKDCTVLLHLLRTAMFEIYGSKPEDEILTLYFPDAHEFDEVVDFIGISCEKFNLKLITVEGTFVEGLNELLKTRSIKVIFMGQRRIDPGCSDLAVLSNSDVNMGYPPFIRVNPLLDWDYSDIWKFILEFKIEYCSLYDIGYTSIGNKLNTVQNKELYDDSKKIYNPAYMLKDFTKERSGRLKKNGTNVQKK